MQKFPELRQQELRTSVRFGRPHTEPCKHLNTLENIRETTLTTRIRTERAENYMRHNSALIKTGRYLHLQGLETRGAREGGGNANNGFHRHRCDEKELLRNVQ